MNDVELMHAGVPVTVLNGPYLDGGKPTEAAVAYYTDLVDRLGEIRAFAVEALLDLYNDTWLTDEIGVLDAASFARRLSRPSVALYDEIGAAIVRFDDGGIFAGHRIEVSIRDGVPDCADLVG